MFKPVHGGHILKGQNMPVSKAFLMRRRGFGTSTALGCPECGRPVRMHLFPGTPSNVTLWCVAGHCPWFLECERSDEFGYFTSWSNADPDGTRTVMDEEPFIIVSSA